MKRALGTLAAISLGLSGGTALAPVPALAQAQSQVLPANAQDFQCFVMMQSRRGQAAQNQSMTPEQRADIINNLTIVSAFYAGRISHYSSAEAVTQYSAAYAQISSASMQQRDAFANQCANFYLSVMEILGTTGQQAMQAQGQAQSQQPQR